MDFMEQGGPLAKLILRELTSGVSQLFPWLNRYNEAILEEKISVAEAVEDFLQYPLHKAGFKDRIWIRVLGLAKQDIT